MYKTADDKAIARTYGYFMASTVKSLQNSGWGSQSSLALACGRTQPMINAITKRIRQASFETQVLIASACGSEYVDFLVEGRDLVNAGYPVVPPPPPPGTAVCDTPGAVGQKLSRLTKRGWLDLDLWLDGYLAGMSRPRGVSPTYIQNPSAPLLPEDGEEVELDEILE